MSVNSSAPTAGRSRLRRLVNRLEVDRATFYSVASRAWQLAAGPVSLVVIALTLSPEHQGYYYTFASLMALQGLIELGLHSVMINVASHEWAELSLRDDGTVAGDPRALDRLAWMARFGFRWYGCVAGIFTIVVGAAGYHFFSRPQPDAVDWQGAWMTLVVLTGAVIWLWGLTALLEGCNQVATVHRVRLLQAITGSVVVWVCLLAGWGLWAVVASAAVRLIWDAWLVLVRYGVFLRSLFRQSLDSVSVNWRDEFWPLQWRVGVRSVFGYFAFNMLTPVLFHFHGPVEAGRLGMTWTVLAALETSAFAWVQTRTASLGMLVARRDYRELDRVFLRVTGISWGLLLLGVLALSGLVAILNSLPWELAQKLSARLLPFEPTLLFGLAVWLLHIPKAQGTYLLVHKRDPLLLPGTMTAVLMALAVWIGGRNAGALGQAVGYLGVVSLAYLPLFSWIWLRCRRAWHADAPMSSTDR